MILSRDLQLPAACPPLPPADATSCSRLVASACFLPSLLSSLSLISSGTANIQPHSVHQPTLLIHPPITSVHPSAISNTAYQYDNDTSPPTMATVSILNVSVRNNPAPFNAPYEFEITFECLEPLQKDLEWKLTYVGSATRWVTAQFSLSHTYRFTTDRRRTAPNTTKSSTAFSSVPFPLESTSSSSKPMHPRPTASQAPTSSA